MKLILLLIPMISLGAGNSGHGHLGLSSLIAPVVNVGILLSFLIWKLKGPVSEMFRTSSKDVKETLDRAAAKAKEAKVLMDAQKQKMDNLTNEVSQIKKRSQDETKLYENQSNEEFRLKTIKMKENASLKLEAEKKLAIEKLNNSLLDEVISNAKEVLRNDKGLSEKASEQLLIGLN